MKTMGMLKIRHAAGDDSGYVMIMSLFVLIILSLIGVGLAMVGINEFTISARSKLMDESYNIASAGIDRGTVELRTDTTLSTSNDGTHNYGTGTPQKSITQTFPAGTTGSFTVDIYQSEANADPAYKVLKSKGTISRTGKTAERTIEARMIAGGGGTDYDASFDYLIYNGCSDDNGHGVWPNLRFGGWGYLAGSFTFDGGTLSNGHAPKGAVYTKGSIDIPVSALGGVTYKGNIVALDDINLQNQWSLSGIWRGAGGLQVYGNVIAGLDGTGNVTLTNTGTAGNTITVADNTFPNSPAIIEGYVATPQNFSTSTIANVGGGVNLGGIIAGGDVNVTGTATLAASSNLGNVFATGKTYVKSICTAGTIFGTINTGRDASGLGLYAETIVSLTIGDKKGIGANNVFSYGKVQAKSTVSNAYISLGNLYADSDSATLVADPYQVGTNYYLGGTGVDFDVILGDVKATRLQSVGKVTVDITNAFYARASDIYAGGDSTSGTGGDGVVINAGSLGATEFATGIQSRGRVYVNGGGLLTTLGNVWAGTNSGTGTGGSGVNISIGSAVQTNVGNIAAVGNVDLSADIYFIFGAGGNNGWVWTGSSANLSYLNMNWFSSSTIGNISAVGNVNMGVTVGANDCTVGRITANGVVNYSVSGAGFNDVYGIKAGGAGGATSNITGSGVTGMRVHRFADLGWNTPGAQQLPPGGPSWYNVLSQPNSNPLGDDANDAITVQGSLNATCPWTSYLVLDGTHNPFLAVYNPVGDSNAGYNCGNLSNVLNFVLYNEQNGWVGALQNWNPGVQTPPLPPIPASPNAALHGLAYWGPTSTTANLPNYLYKNPPMSGAGEAAATMLGLANLTAPVNILTPNWAYFNEKASMDDIADGPTTQWKICPTCHKKWGKNPDPPIGNGQWPASCLVDGTSLGAVAITNGPPHLISDGGPGDQDGAPNAHPGEIYLVWDSTKHYSSNETVYAVDGADIVIQTLNWSGEGAAFEGTVVTKGNVTIQPTVGSDWFVGTNDTLNVVAGIDIRRISPGGLNLVTENNCNFHFWADHNIDLANMQLGIAGINSFTGSLTAGNKVSYASNSFWDSTTFKWSRWAIDPVAWVPPFKVLSWKEI